MTPLPECAICGLESDQLYKCKMCGERFCEECGSVEDKLCLFCLEDEEEDSSEKEWEEEEEDEEELE